MTEAVVPSGHLLATIESQPGLIERLLSEVQPVRQAAGLLKDAGRIFLIGTGTSYHGAQAGEHLFRSAGFDAIAMPAFEFAQYRPALRPDDALVVVSHRGVKLYTEAALESFRQRSSRWVAITGYGSPISGDGVVRTLPQEASAVHTASHTGAMTRLAQLAVELATRAGRSRPFWEPALALLPESVAAAVAARPRCQEVLDAMDLDRPTHFLGGGPAWATANEGSLKLREAAYVQAEGHQLENFLHGPMISVESGQTVFCVTEPGPSLERAQQAVQALVTIGVRVVAVGSAADQVDGASFSLSLHRLPEALAPIANVVPLQWIAYLASLRRGVNADTFRRDDAPYGHALAALRL
jgi:glutamine---fructose-6-phosphate transaminase (isomerizing)